MLSGLFGVGGGFILTPLLFFLGIPPAVAVASAANQIAGSSFSALLVHLQRKTVDIKMGVVLLAGGVLGSAAGVQIYTLLRRHGQFELVVSLLYVVLLGTIGALMLIESLRALRRRNDPNAVLISRKRHTWSHGLPLKMRFRTSQLYVSAIPPFVIGFFVGVLAAIMGVGGGFIMVPAMIYVIGMPTKVVIGTSLFQFLFVTGFTTVLQAVQNKSVDVVLTVFLLVGGVIGAQVGASLADPAARRAAAHPARAAGDRRRLPAVARPGAASPPNSTRSRRGNDLARARPRARRRRRRARPRRRRAS